MDGSDGAVSGHGAAQAGDCKSFFDESDTCVADLKTQGLPIDPCIYSPGTNFDTYLRALAGLGCGP